MRISAEWLDRGIGTSAELRATFSQLAIEVGGRRVSRFVDNRTERLHERIVMPAYPVAQGLARVWWQLIGGRTGTIGLRRFRDGYAVPDLRFAPDGRYVDVVVNPFDYENPPVTFPNQGLARVPVGALERDLGAFVASVVDRLSAKRVRGTWLAERWTAIEASGADAEERRFCEAAGALGIDPYLCDEREAAAIEAAGDLFQGDALGEAVAGQSLDSLRRTIEWVVAAEAALGERAAMPDLAEIGRIVRAHVHAANAPMISSKPWELGYRIGEECRMHLDIGADRIFADAPDVAALFGAHRFAVAAGRVAGLRAEANVTEDGARIVVASFSEPTSRAFATMRAAGDVIAYGEPGRAPVTDTHSYRQAVGRAFAIEMLAPAESVLAMKRDGMTVDEIAAQRRVSPVAIERHLENLEMRRAA